MKKKITYSEAINKAFEYVLKKFPNHLSLAKVFGALGM